jgi:hypothetical protein
MVVEIFEFEVVASGAAPHRKYVFYYRWIQGPNITRIVVLETTYPRDNPTDKDYCGNVG